MARDARLALPEHLRELADAAAPWRAAASGSAAGSDRPERRRCGAPNAIFADIKISLYRSRRSAARAQGAPCARRLDALVEPDLAEAAGHKSQPNTVRRSVAPLPRRGLSHRISCIAIIRPTSIRFGLDDLLDRRGAGSSNCALYGECLLATGHRLGFGIGVISGCHKSRSWRNNDAPRSLFNSARTKIKRAEQHIAELNEKLIAYAKTDPITVSVEIKAVNSVATISWTELDPICCAILGDAIHNLRTALDTMAAELARLNQKKDKGVYFRFADSEKNLNAQIHRKEFNRAGADAVALLKKFALTDGRSDLYHDSQPQWLRRLDSPRIMA